MLKLQEQEQTIGAGADDVNAYQSSEREKEEKGEDEGKRLSRHRSRAGLA
jgi:hypothetical protein